MTSPSELSRITRIDSGAGSGFVLVPFIVRNCNIVQRSHTLHQAFMRFSVDHDGELVIFTIKEPLLDSSIAAEVKHELLIICQPEVKALVIDLSRVQLCDTQGLSALLLANRQMNENEGFLILVGVQGQVKSLIDISRLSDKLEIRDTVQDAVQWLSEE
ncbi:MAG: anti-sigma factor antagonist [Chlorobi bacterium]|nr:MAG: STAS domain-containing protein [Bacteroidota bacterium]MBL1161994.1 anti-sigma factor antagonist [Chlorobiota bacterium]